MYKINKGVDRPPEVLGVRGMNFLTLLAGGTVASLVVVALLIAALGLNPMFTFGGYIIGIFILYHNVVRLSKEYGERGFTKYQARKKFPTLVTVRSSAAYRRLRPDQLRKTKK